MITRYFILVSLNWIIWYFCFHLSLSITLGSRVLSVSYCDWCNNSANYTPNHFWIVASCLWEKHNNCHIPVFCSLLLSSSCADRRGATDSGALGNFLPPHLLVSSVVHTASTNTIPILSPKCTMKVHDRCQIRYTIHYHTVGQLLEVAG